MKIGILETGVPPEELRKQFEDYPTMFAKLLAGHGFTFDSWHVENGEFPTGPEEADGWLITGSRHGVYEDKDWIRRLESLIRDIVAAGKPLVGICFGHQAIAKALGGTVEKFDGGWAVGQTDYDFGGETLTLNAWHQDQVITPPEGAEVLAGNDFCRYGVLLYPGKAFSVQAHPEYGDDFVEGLATYRGKGVVPDAQLDAARERMGGPLDSARVIDDIAHFFQHRSLS